MTPEEKAVKFVLDRLQGKTVKESRIAIVKQQAEDRESVLRRLKRKIRRRNPNRGKH